MDEGARVRPAPNHSSPSNFDLGPPAELGVGGQTIPWEVEEHNARFRNSDLQVQKFEFQFGIPTLEFRLGNSDFGIRISEF